MDERLADARVARAFDRVLESESTARAAVAQCERECGEALERAREQRRRILDRAQRRIVALHLRSTEQLETRLADANEERAKSAQAVLLRLSDPLKRQRALERLAAALTSVAAEPRVDVP